VLGALVVAGRATASAAQLAGRAVADQWRAIDPDVRQQVVELPLIGLTMLTTRHAPVEALPDDGHRPVVFVHGLGGARGNFLPMRSYFRVMGRGRTYAVGFEGGVPVEALAARLADYLRAVIAANGLGEGRVLDVVAHSMGGVVTRLALEDPSLAERVATVVTLGTPHHGTWAARYAGSDPAVQLRPDAPAVGRLRAQWEGRATRPLPRLVCVWSRADVLMLPAESARVEGAEGVELEGFSHSAFLLRPRAWQRVFATLEAAS
jgi:triacylglycerol esterase/lipase EstA (alpha/beta hydrolase family)